ncbi:membrane protein insertion efficiency factor YidD [Helcobacillus sp. ACRRO]|uniref:membrane protein insertion efficiency factor YidD n=1 Tax=Helcobacillus sp. ACRRO TaxID=2918202 RepID=UPI001EF6DC1E|nr:membrane protein insertion efficiency factor YidD [Helcobacillus sp. ACRRO]MCG7427450.1 membrane protein insertion efficiency factor YidD [Helcobacillus sp. ACRRO]
MRSPLQWPTAILTALVRAYQRGISPYTPPACGFTPVCSQYAMDSLRRHGAVKGTVLSAWRILRCNPLTGGGLDPTPAPGMWSNPRALRRPEDRAGDDL